MAPRIDQNGPIRLTLMEMKLNSHLFRFLPFFLLLTALIESESHPVVAQIGPPDEQLQEPNKGGKVDEQTQMRNAIEEKNAIKARQEEERKKTPPQKKPAATPKPTIQPTPKEINVLDLGERPKLVVGITVDQMRMDYLYRFWDAFGDGGFKRLVQGGFVCGDHHFGYAPTYTGPGHASIYTGTTPRYHGIIGNDWYDRSSGESVYCAADPEVQTTGIDDTQNPSGHMSPHRMEATTIGDELKMATGMQSKVIGISIKDRGAILPAGHLADAAYWFYGKDEGKFITSTRYMSELPRWAEKWNKGNWGNRYLKTTWAMGLSEDALSIQTADNTPYERPFNGDQNATYPYDLKKLSEANGGMDILKSTPIGNTLVVDFALAAIQGESLGQDDITDLLAISFSSTDYVGHQFGVHAWETMDIYVRLDQQLERLFTAMDEQVGRDQWLCWLTADHGAATVPSFAQEAGIPVDYWKPGNLIDDVRADLNAHYGEENWVLNYSNDQFFLNRPLIEERGLNRWEMQRRIQRMASGFPGVLMAVTGEDLITGNTAGDEVIDRLHMGWSPVSSGDVMIVTKPGWIQYSRSGTTHGSPFAYDTHVPLLFYGWHVDSGITYERTYIRDIAPTIAALIHSPMPNACTGRPIPELFER
ncbi:MAG: alkaline phosphatase family protein [Bacteroidetes bacterium]|nr:alkaline phosphatase family protein [Bacteroidota bacterium]